jgi:hypothetical protein
MHGEQLESELATQAREQVQQNRGIQPAGVTNTEAVAGRVVLEKSRDAGFQGSIPAK